MREVIPSFVPAYHKTPNHKDFATLEEALAAQEAYEETVKKDTIFRCVGNLSTGEGCGKYSKVSEAEFVQTHWYVSPHGCTGGDYWVPGEGVVICPACSRRNRLYATPELEALKRYFMKVRDEYRD